MILSKAAGSLFLLLGACFAALPGLTQNLHNEKSDKPQMAASQLDESRAPVIPLPVATEKKVQHWIRANTNGQLDGGSALFYVNKEDQGKILIILGNQVYLLETRGPSIKRVTSTIPKANREFEAADIKTEELKGMTATIQHIAGTPKFAGGMVWLGWSVCFLENGTPNLRQQAGCYMFIHYEEDPPPEHPMPSHMSQ